MQLLSTDYKFAVSFAILIIVLLFMPTGPLQGEIDMSTSASLACCSPRMVGLLFVLTGCRLQSWNLALHILNMALISAIMALGVNMQWGYAGLFNSGIMGFVALGGLAVVLVSPPPVPEGWAAGGPRIVAGAGLRGRRPSRRRSLL